MKLDAIGDIHGELPALVALGRELGYDVENGWTHPEQRHLVFLGDLVDRGAHSLEVVQLVQSLVEAGRATCIMGNHEYNLVAWWLRIPGYEEGKPSNEPTRVHIANHREVWQPALAFLRDLPIAIALPELRLVHAVWHVPSLERVHALLAPMNQAPAGASEVQRWINSHVVIGSPFTSYGLKEGLPGPTHGAHQEKIDAPHEILMKGFERGPVDEFDDSEGVKRKFIRVPWWQEADAPVLRDRPQVVGHYWNLPPIENQSCPPHPSGHKLQRLWQERLVGSVPERGRAPFHGDVACVDYQGVTLASDEVACVGALRWPERELVWATDRRTRVGRGGD